MGRAHLGSQKGWIVAAVSPQERERPMVSLWVKAIVLTEFLAQSMVLSGRPGDLHSMTAPQLPRASARLSSMYPA